MGLHQLQQPQFSAREKSTEEDRSFGLPDEEKGEGIHGQGPAEEGGGPSGMGRALIPEETEASSGLKVMEGTAGEMC
jgi:hypothetical protein